MSTAIVTSPYARPVTPGVTAFLGRTKVGIRYEERVLCMDCSVTLDERDLDIPLEKHADPSQSCAHCHSDI